MALSANSQILPVGIQAGAPFALGDVLFVEVVSPPTIGTTPRIFVDTTKTPQQIQVGSTTTRSTIIGTLAVESAPNTPADQVILGTSAASADGQDSVVIGHAAAVGASHSSNGSVAIGAAAVVGGASSNAGGGVAIGDGAAANNGIAIGASATCLLGQVAVGPLAFASNFGCAVGGGAVAQFASGHGAGAIAIGRGATAGESTDVVISSACQTGGGSATNGGNICVIGSSGGATILSGFNNILVGGGNGTAGTDNDKNPAAGIQSNCILIGGGIVAAHDQVIMIGRGATSTAANQCIIGGTFAPIATVYFGNGPVAAAPQNVTVGVTGGVGTDQAGANLGISGGVSTGAHAGGSIFFLTTPAGVSSSTPNAAVIAMTISAGTNPGTVTFAAAPKLTTTVAAGVARTGTLTNLPTTATAGDPQLWAAILVGSTRYVIPLWAA